MFSSMKRGQAVNIIVVVIDVEGCLDISEQLNERSGLKHSRERPRRGLPCSVGDHFQFLIARSVCTEDRFRLEKQFSGRDVVVA